MNTALHPKRFYDYNTFLHEKFGGKVYKICLDAGFTCPNRDGKRGVGGCIYCNNASFSPGARLADTPIHEQIAAGMAVGRNRFKAEKFIAYFQAFTNTYAPLERLRELYSQVLVYPEVVGLAIGTRPDAVDTDKIALLAELAQNKFVSLEYGVQSMHDATLAWIRRGHTYGDFVAAMDWTRGRGIHVCAHVMLGFPCETRAGMVCLADEMTRVGIAAIKIHNLIVTRDTPLAQIYAQEPFPLFAYDEYVELVCDFLEHLSPVIVVERLCATTPDEYLIAPRWHKSPGQLSQDVSKCLLARNSYQGRLAYSQ
jgi:radical SAM protein (TIGR01212 family)